MRARTQQAAVGLVVAGIVLVGLIGAAGNVLDSGEPPRPPTPPPRFEAPPPLPPPLPAPPVPAPTEPEDALRVRFDAQGRPVDAFGTPYQIHHERDGSGVTTTVTSAGHDRRFGTDDDRRRAVPGTIQPASTRK